MVLVWLINVNILYISELFLNKFYDCKPSVETTRIEKMIRGVGKEST